MTILRENLTQTLHLISDPLIQQAKQEWYANNHSHRLISNKKYIQIADDWFKSTRLNSLDNWDKFDCVDATIGCTHFIEAFVLRHGWNGFQILVDEYNYYTLMGKEGVEIKDLQPNMPLIISIPNWKNQYVYSKWEEILRECEYKNIDIHIDFAWIAISKNVEIDLGHPCIKSFAMSTSKLDMTENRIGLRWSKQRHMDSITMFNRWQPGVNANLMSFGAYFMQQISRDHGWNYHSNNYDIICDTLGLEKTIFVNVAKDNGHPVGVAKILKNLAR